MESTTAKAIEILQKLVGFETISARPNLDFISYVEEYLRGEQLEYHLSFDESEERANLHALTGPSIDGGVVLNGHSDVVPVVGQDWASDPFTLNQRDDRLYGRGAVDMKGFLACMLAAIPVWKSKPLKRPVHLSMCYDEEIGGFGAPVLVGDMGKTVPKPEIAIIGEPTDMKIVTGHKGGYELQTNFIGSAAHSCDPGKGVNAIQFATKFINNLEEVSQCLASRAERESTYDPPYCTINVGKISGGTARNIVADSCSIDWELRSLPDDDADLILEEIISYTKHQLLPQMRSNFAEADISTELFAKVPALDEKQSGKAAALIGEITGINSTQVASFATDAGHFCNAGISTAVFGPGNIDRAHKADEFIKISEIAECLKFFDRLGDELSM